MRAAIPGLALVIGVIIGLTAAIPARRAFPQVFGSVSTWSFTPRQAVYRARGKNVVFADLTAAERQRVSDAAAMASAVAESVVKERVFGAAASGKATVSEAEMRALWKAQGSRSALDGGTFEASKPRLRAAILLEKEREAKERAWSRLRRTGKIRLYFGR